MAEVVKVCVRVLAAFLVCLAPVCAQSTEVRFSPFEDAEARALAVKRYLVAQGVDSNVLVARGYGESQPRAENDSALGRARNRRVELKVIAND